MKKAILFFLLFFPFSFAQESAAFYSVQTHFGQIYRADIDSAAIDTMLNGIRSAGIKMIRDECYWSLIETTRGVYSFHPLFDYYINSAKQRGIDVLLILNYNNPLYAPHAGSAVTTDSNRAAFTEYCRRVVERYAPQGVKYYEIWNEPNIPMFWDPAPNAQQYKLLLQSVYPVIKSVDTTITVMGCATSPAEGNPAPYISWLSFITQVFNAGGGAFMDAVSFHQYRVDKAPETYLQNDVNSLKAVTGSKPIYLTEIGYPTSSVWPNVSQAKQAEYLARVYLLGRRIPELKMISWYDYKNDGEDPANNEHNFGIVDFTYAPKPAYNYYGIMRSALGDRPYSSSTSNSGAHSFVFGAGSEPVWAFWHESGEANLIYNFGAARVLNVKQSTGQEYYIHDKDGAMTVRYTTSPAYYCSQPLLPANTYLEITPIINTVIVNQKINFSMRGLTPEGKTVFIDSSLVQWSVTTGNGEIDSLGRFRALSPGLCRVEGTYNFTQYSHIFTIEPAYTYLEIEPFNSVTQFTPSFFNMLDTIDVLKFIDSSYTTPPGSMEIKYRFRYQGIDKHRVYLDCNYPLTGEPDSILIDVYGNGNGHVFNFMLEDADGQVFSVNSASSALINQYGWKTVKVAINKFGTSFNHPAKLKRLTFFAVKTGGIVDSVYSGKILLDNLRIHNGIISGFESSGESSRFNRIAVSNPYPNPFGKFRGKGNNSTEIRIADSQPSFSSISLYNVTGSLIHRKEFITQAGTNILRIDADEINLSSGFYLYRINIRDESFAGKIIYIK
ncbi:MAG: cellulase family glycosylhydrolase [Ignavibacteriaceae bacterium]|nr:cellulase family glycosylhydrolase [Ignavibacteriaceae bacterium]